MRNIYLCALILAVSTFAFADAAAAASRSITVNVTHSSSGYSCQYTGGDNPAGDVTFHVGTTGTVVLHAPADRSYTIDNVNLMIDPHSQLSIPNKSPTTVTIQDTNTVAQEATYKVTMKDPTTGATIPCDPKIINN